MGVAWGEGIAALTVIEDWHLLRMGGPFGCDLIPPDRLALYRGAVGCTAPWVPLLAMIQSYLGQLPARDFRIDPVTGDVSEN